MPKISLSLPQKGKIFVATGQKVLKDDILAEFSQPLVVLIDLSRDLGVKGAKLFSHLVKKIGDKVNQGEVLAVKKSLFKKRVCKSPVTGTISYLEEEKGIMGIEKVSKSKKLISPFSGQINEIINEKTIVLDFNGVVFEAKQAEGNSWGQIYLLTKEEDKVDIYDIKKDSADKILVGYSWSLESLKKALTLGAAVIGVSFDERPERLLKNHYLESDLPCIMMVGRDTFFELTKLNSQEALIAGSDKKLFVENL